MTKSLFFGVLSLLCVNVYSNYRHSILLCLFVLFLGLSYKSDKRIFFIINVIIVFEIIIGFRGFLIQTPIKGVRDFLLGRIDDKKAKEYLGLIIFNDKNSELYTLSLNLSISYLIIISGLHINLLYTFFLKILSFFIDFKISFIISLILLFSYVLIIGFPVSSLKSLIILILSIVNRKLNKFDKFFITMIVIYILLPNSIYSFSYIYSFLLTFVILCIGAYIPNNRILSMLSICFISFLITIPINIHISNKINLLSVIFSFIFTYPFLILVVISFFVLLFPSLSSFYVFLVDLLKKGMIVADKYSIYLHGFNFSFIDYIIYFGLIIVLILLINKKSKFYSRVIFPIFMLLISIFSINNRNALYEVVFVNVYQGDCIIFKSKYGKDIYMVDTGGSRTISITEKVLKPMFELMNIDCIRGLIITHSDYDHCGALNELINIIDIKDIYYKLENISIFGYKFININEIEYDNENDNSIVLYGEFYNMKILLMGDVSSLVEEDIINNYPGLMVDIIKVAHHGSKYSTSDLLLDEYKPRIAILSYGYNHYGHPSSEVINKLKKRNIIIYSTFDDGSLFFFSNYKKEIYLRVLK